MFVVRNRNLQGRIYEAWGAWHFTIFTKKLIVLLQFLAKIKVLLWEIKSCL